MMKLKVILTLTALLSFGTLKSQKRVWEKFGDESMALNDAFAASQFYQKALAADSSDLELWYKYMQSLSGYQNFESALVIAHQIRPEVSKELYPDFTYDLARIYKHLAMYDSANTLFKSYLSERPANLLLEKRAQLEVEQFPKLKELLQDTVEVGIVPIPGAVNTGASEFATAFLNDSVLYFSSLRSKSVLEAGKVISADEKAGIYRAELVDSVWIVKYKLQSDNQGLSMANGSFSKDRSKFFFTQCEIYSNCQIYEGKIKGDSLVQVKRLPAEINAEGAMTTQPFYFEINDQVFLFYVSNQLGGIGGTDLYVSEYRNGWKAGKNLGKGINTVGNELSPFYDGEDSTLYFASDGHYNLGGFDLFAVKGVAPKNWGAAINMGLPINSRLNDLYYTPQNNERAWLTSSRPGSITEKDAPCCNDIYELKYPKASEPVDLFSPITLTMIDQQPVVYFHNDRPNEDSWDTLTPLTYRQTYDLYEPRQQEYRQGFSGQFKGEKSLLAQQSVDTFFNMYLRKGWRDLIQFTEELIAALDSGISVEVELHGFASPLTKSDYNVNLSKRRINSIENFLIAYRDSVLKPYLEGTASNGAKLNYVRTPNGEYKAKTGVSDDYYDVSNSIYNPAAALERKVELRAKLIQWKEVPIWNLEEQEKILTVSQGVETVPIYLLNEGQSVITFQYEGSNSNDPVSEEREVRLEKGQVHLLEVEVRGESKEQVFTMKGDGVAYRLTISIE